MGTFGASVTFLHFWFIDRFPEIVKVREENDSTTKVNNDIELVMEMNNKLKLNKSKLESELNN